MLMNDIKDGGKRIVISGINSVSIALSKTLINYKNNVLFWDDNSSIIEQYKNKIDNPLEILDNIDFGLNLVDFIIISKIPISINFDFENMIKTSNKFEDKVYLESEVVSELFPNNKFIGIFGDTYEEIVPLMLKNIFADMFSNFIELPYSDNDIVLEDLDLSDNNAFIVNSSRLEFLKNIKFNSICFLENKDSTYFNKIRDILLKQGHNSNIILNIDDADIKDFYNEEKTNENFPTKMLPISISKMIENGCSYVNGTIYCYYNDNRSYDLIENDYLKFDIFKISILSSVFIASDFGIKIETVIENIKSFKYVKNILEYVKHDDNLTFISNIWANSENLLKAPFELYSNIYAIFITNGRQENFFRLKNYKKGLKKIFLVDIFDTINLTEEEQKMNITKHNNIKDALNAVPNVLDKSEENEDSIILLSPINYDKMNKIYYKNQGDEFKKLIETL